MGTRSYSLLIADNSKSVNNHLQVQLANSGYTISGYARNEKEAIEQTKHNKPDVILMDTELCKGPNGCETVRQIQAFCDSPVIFLVSGDDDAVYHSLKTMDAAGIAKKPVCTGELLFCIKSVLEKHELIQENQKKDQMLNRLNTKLLHETENIKYYEQQILRSKHLYFSSFDALNEMIFVVDAGLNIILRNNAFKVLTEKLGIESSVLGQSADILAHYAEGFSKSDYRIVLKSGKEILHRNQKINPDLYIEIRKSPVFDQQGNINRVITVIKDVTSFNSTEHSLIKSEKKYRELMDFLPEIILETNSKGMIRYANQHAWKKLGYSKKDRQKGISIYDIFSPEEKERAKKNIQKSLGGEKTGSKEYQVQNSRNEKFSALVYTKPVIENHIFSGLRTIIIDISDRKKAEEQLKESLQTTEAIFENLPFGIIIIDKNKTIKRANTEALNLFGKVKEKIIGNSCLSCVCNHNKTQCPTWDFNKGIDNVEKKIINATGREIPVLKIAVPVRLNNEDLLLVSLIDISESNKTQEKLKEQGKQLVNSLRQQEVLSGISMTLNTQTEFTIKMNDTLKIIGQNTGADRVFIYENLQDKELISNTFEWCRKGIPSLKKKQQRIPREKITPLLETLDKQGVLMCSDVFNTHQEIQKDFFDKETKSVLLFPIYLSDDRKGFLGMEDCTEYREWSKNDAELLRTVAGIVTNSYRRWYAEKNLIEGEKTTNAIMNAIPDMIFHLNHKGDFINYKSAKMGDLLLPPDEFLGKNLVDVFPETFAKIFQSSINESLIHDETSIEYMLPINGVETSFEARFVKVKAREVICLVRNISDRKKYEKELKEARENADLANNAKSEFLANMSHEIRTPLNAILGFAESLIPKITYPNHKKVVQTIHSSGQVLLSLINDILDLSKIEANKLDLNPEPLSLNNVFSEIEQIFRQIAEEKGLEFIIQIDEGIPQTLVLDEIRLRQILINLTGNAIKFTDKGYVKIFAGGTVREDKLDLALSVKDTGIGIPENQQSLIFDAFKQQSGQSTRKYGGSGLGLAICKKLVEKMKGIIEVHSLKESGTEFTVSIPGVEISQAAPNYAQQNTMKENLKFKPACVLIVDDVQNNIATVLNLMEDQEINFLVANSGKEALSILEKQIPDLIIMDIRMNELDGIQTTRNIKKNDKLKNIPVIAYTASVMNFDNYISRKYFNSLLPKPAGKHQIINELKKYLDYTLAEGVEKEKQKENTTHLMNISPEKSRQIAPLMDRKYLDEWNNYLDNLLVRETEELAIELNQLAEEYNIAELKSFTEKLIVSVTAFEVDQIQHSLAEFGEWAEYIKKDVLNKMNV